MRPKSSELLLLLLRAIFGKQNRETYEVLKFELWPTSGLICGENNLLKYAYIAKRTDFREECHNTLQGSCV